MPRQPDGLHYDIGNGPVSARDQLNASKHTHIELLKRFAYGL